MKGISAFFQCMRSNQGITDLSVNVSNYLIFFFFSKKKKKKKKKVLDEKLN